MANEHDPARRFKDNDLYFAMQRRGAGPITAARIASAQEKEEASQSSHVPYDQRPRKELYARAKELGIRGRSSMTRAELIDALRAH